MFSHTSPGTPSRARASRHSPSRSRWPCETTRATTDVTRAPRGRRRRLRAARARPGEVRRARVTRRPRAARAGRVVEHASERLRQLLRAGRVDREAGVADRLGEPGRVARDHGRPAGHRLERRKPEALVERREHERPRGAVERGQLLLLDVPDEVDAAGQARAQDRVEHVDAAAPVAARDDELAVASRAPSGARTPRSRAARSCAPAAPRRRARTAGRCRSARARGPPASSSGRNAGLTPFGIATTLAGSSPYWSHDVGARELRDRDHALGAAHRAAHEPEQRAIPAREQLRRARRTRCRARSRPPGSAGAARRSSACGRARPPRGARAPGRRTGCAGRGSRRRAAAGAPSAGTSAGRPDGSRSDAGERQLGRRGRQLAQQVDGVALVPGAPAPDRVGVDQDERRRAHCTSSRQSATTDAAASSQLVPRRGCGRGCVSAWRMPSEIASGVDGSK